VVDSFSTDKTIEIAQKCAAKSVQNKWPGNQAKQFNWALENLPIKTKWVLRLDADEYLYSELIEEINTKLDTLPEDVTGVVFRRRHIFMGKWIKRGTYPVKLLRLFRYQKAVCEQRWMDEHIQLLEGRAVEFEHDFADHNLNNLSWWTQKHNGYAIREAIDLLDIELDLLGQKQEIVQLSEQAATKRAKKLKYAKQPLFWRSFAYFIYRYIVKGGFLEGKEGFLWHFLQGWWYRTLVDAKILEIKKACGTDTKKIKAYLKKEHNIELE
jgi:glycosyltransferase involved in cell wall biosynthesis